MEGQTISAFPKNLRRIREERGLSQDRLAEMIGAKQASIAQYEAGTAFPRPQRLEALAVALHTTPLELLDEPRPKSTMTYEEVVLLANYRRLNNEGKSMLERQAEVMVASGLYAK